MFVTKKILVGFRQRLKNSGNVLKLITTSVSKKSFINIPPWKMVIVR